MRELSNAFFCAALLVLVAVITGCSSSDSGIPPSRKSSAPYFEETAQGALRKYSAFYIAPIEVYTVEGDRLRRVDDSEVQSLANDFRGKLIKQLGDRYTILPQPSRSVIFIKVAMTDVSTNYAMFQLLPGIVVPNAMRGGASIEAEFVDSVSNQRVALFRDSRQGARQGFFSGLGKWDGVQKAFDEWAALLAGSIRR
jgi:hypothetical protein